MSRSAIAWLTLGLLALSCFGPWVTVTTNVNVTEQHGALEGAFYGGRYLLGLASMAALGLLVRRPALTRLCAVVAAILTLLMNADLPETMLQFGYMAELTWGAYLAFVSSLVLAVAARPVRRRPMAPAADYSAA